MGDNREYYIEPIAVATVLRELVNYVVGHGTPLYDWIYTLEILASFLDYS